MDYLDLLKKIWAALQLFFSVVFAVLVVVALLSTTGGTQTGLQATLKLIVGGVLAGALVSSVYEKFAWFQKLTSDQRLRAISATVIGLPILSQVLLGVIPAEYWITLEAYWPIIVTIAVGWLGSQVWHAVVNKRIANGEP